MELASLTLHQLRVFHTVASTGNLTRAAEQLGMSQPGVSMQVKQLERVLGLPLLEPVGRQVRLTEVGMLVDQHAIEVLNQVNHLADAISEIRGGEGGRLVVAADTTVGIYVMPPLLGAWRRHYDNIEIDLRVGNHDAVCGQLRTNEVDFAVVSTVPDLPGLIPTEFIPNRLVVVAPPHHHLAARGQAPLPVSVLADEPILVREGGSSTSAAVDAFFRSVGITPQVAMRLGNIGAIKQGVASGLGLAVVSERAIGNELAAGSLVVLDVVGFPLERMWHIVHVRGKRLSPAARSFKTYLEAARAELMVANESAPAPSKAVLATKRSQKARGAGS
jgi:DNA-binding transcriptional LysR family regulator